MVWALAYAFLLLIPFQVHVEEIIIMSVDKSDVTCMLMRVKSLTLSAAAGKLKITSELSRVSLSLYHLVCVCASVL